MLEASAAGAVFNILLEHAAGANYRWWRLSKKRQMCEQTFERVEPMKVILKGMSQLGEK